jgi:hypothetical protein
MLMILSIQQVRDHEVVAGAEGVAQINEVHQGAGDSVLDKLSFRGDSGEVVVQFRRQTNCYRAWHVVLLYDSATV